MGRKVADYDPNVDSFLRKVQELDAKKRKEDNERVHKLEEEVELKRSKVGDLDKLRRSNSNPKGPPQKPKKPDSLKSTSEEETNDIKLVHPVAREEKKQVESSDEEQAPQLPKRPNTSILNFPDNSFVDSLPNFNNSKAPKVIRSEDVMKKPKREFVINRGNGFRRERPIHGDEQDENPPALPLRRANPELSEEPKSKPKVEPRIGANNKAINMKEKVDIERKPLIPSKPTSLKVTKPETSDTIKKPVPPPAPKSRNQNKEVVSEEDNHDLKVKQSRSLSPKPKAPAKPSNLQVSSDPIAPKKTAPLKPTKPKDLTKNSDLSPPEAVTKAKEIKSKPVVLPRKTNKTNFNQPQEEMLQSQLQQLRGSTSSGKNRDFNAAQETILSAQLNGLKPRKRDQSKPNDILPNNSYSVSSQPVPIPFMVDPKSSRVLEKTLTKSRTIDGSEIGIAQKHQNLSHPNMNRAKGPKRRLPKTLSNPEPLKHSQPTPSTTKLGKKVPPPKPAKNRIVSNSEIFL